MSELDSGLTAARLPPDKLPPYHAHHRAKHELLRRYMDVWMPKLGFTYNQVGVVDGFARAGCYRQPVPMFAFVDPRGYKENPFSHIEDVKRRMPNKSEVMVYLPASFMARFLATGITAAALTTLYGGPTCVQGEFAVSGGAGADQPIRSTYRPRWNPTGGRGVRPSPAATTMSLQDSVRGNPRDPRTRAGHGSTSERFFRAAGR